MISRESTQTLSIKIKQQNLSKIEENLELLQFNHEKQNAKFPLNLTEIEKIQNIWYGNKKKHQLIKQKTKLPMEITYLNIKSIAYNSIPTEEVINSYIFLINDKMNKQSNFKLFDSLMSTSFLGFNQDLLCAKKNLRRKGINKSNFPIFTLNNVFHQQWIFAVVTQNLIYLYDSRIKPKQEYDKISIRQLLSLADWYYETKHQLCLCETFPQQSNQRQSGVMMILGIRDILNKAHRWTFDEQIAKQFRPKMALELLDEFINSF